MQNGRPASTDDGFTLVELLVVIAILGVLAAMAAFSVRSITDRGEVASCAMDARNLTAAEETYHALNQAFATEAELITENLLRDESALHDVVLVGDDFSLVGTGVCVIAEGGGGGGGPALGTPTPTTWAGVPALRYGTGTSVVLLLSVGPGNTQAASDWAAVLAIPEPATATVIWVDTAALIASDPVPTVIIDALLAPAHAALIWETTTWDVQTGSDPPVAADAYVLGASTEPTCINVPSPVLFGSCTITEADL